METLEIRNPQGDYRIQIEKSLISQISSFLPSTTYSKNCCLVTNTTVGALYAKNVMESLRTSGFHPTSCEIPDGESYKTFETLQKLYNHFVANDLDRNSLVISLGGGVVSDIAGFAAATFMRGLPWMAIPTSLLAMVDASVGGKTALNLPSGKNLVGAFKQPEMVLVDPNVLSTLPKVEYRCGLAEVIKHALINHVALFEALETQDNLDWDWVIKEAISVKSQVVQEDPFEKGHRAVLNLGHTFGHAFEKLSNFKIRHGEAVACGLLCAARLSHHLKLCSSDLVDRIKSLLQKYELPTNFSQFSPSDIVSAMQTDKKKLAGQFVLILLKNIGETEIVRDVQPDAIKSIL